MRKVGVDGPVFQCPLGIGTGNQQILVFGVLRDHVGDRGVAILERRRDHGFAHGGVFGRRGVVATRVAVIPVTGGAVAAIPGLVLVFVDGELRIQGVEVEFEVVTDSPADGATHPEAVFGEFLHFGLRAPRRGVGNAVAVEIARGIAWVDSAVVEAPALE